MKHRIHGGAVLLAASLALAGCAGANGPAPTHAEVTQAIHAMIAAEYAPGGSAQPLHGKDAAAPTVASVKDYGCDLAPDMHGYLCDTVITLTRPGHAPKPMTRTVRMVKTASGWHATMQ